MSRRSKKKLESPGQEWLTTYSDMMTLLLCFFVLLYSMSSLNATKFKKAAAALTQAFGGGSSGSSISAFDKSSIGTIPVNDNKQSGNDSDSNNAIYSKVDSFIKNNNLEGKANIKKESAGVTIELQEKVLFDSGSADIKDESREILNKISILLKNMPNKIIVEGHTDNLPIQSGYYQSNWELSTDRAVKIVRYFIENQGLEPERFSAVGYGQYRPIADNNTAEGRKANRRVDIIISSSESGGDNNE